ncbi:putative Ig domain-containing protein [Subtercola sp. PAMC28395]|uniref:putative Ig domain-containing protein n=1 Tax=Subtercola sp. PAMC28395 TaxID=2846775 RepID=UPI001C0AE75D|nr:putative Ig domain-containing protein [Subtercola sp. PAMC28395]QWT24289.1 putative Ig domain-containing protein [Subtercola sp. PAMC28395]
MRLSRSSFTFRTLAASVLGAGALGLVLFGSASAAHAVVAPVIVGSHPQGMAYDSATGNVFVVNSADGSVSRFDGRAAVTPVADTFPAVGTDLRGVAVDPVTGRVFVASHGSASPKIFDGELPVPTITSTAVGAAPDGVAVDASSGRVFVANSGAATVSILDGRAVTPTVIATVGVGATPRGIAVDQTSHEVYVGNAFGSSVSFFDGSAAAPVATTIGGFTVPGALAVDNSTHRVFVTNLLISQISWFDEADPAATLDSMDIPGAPTGLSVDPSTHSVFVSGNSDSAVTQFDGRDPKKSQKLTLSTGSGPRGIVADASQFPSVYVANENDDTVSRLPNTIPHVAPTLTSGALPPATVGVPYSFTFTASGLPAPTFELGTGDTLPAGLSLNATTGEISGTPTTPGSITFDMVAINDTLPASAKFYTVDVAPAVTPNPTPTPTPTATSGSTGASGSAGGSNSSSSGTTATKPQLAHTGLDIAALWPLIAVGAMLVIVGAFSLPRRTSRSSRRSE